MAESFDAVLAEINERGLLRVTKPMERLQAAHEREVAHLRDALAEQYRKGWEAGHATAHRIRNALVTQPEARGVEGMVLVPREPTEAMREAFVSVNHAFDFEAGRLVFTGDSGQWLACYRAMLAAAPEPVRVDEMEDLLRSAHEIALRQGADTNWEGLAKSIAKIGIGPITARHYFAEGTPRATINKHLDLLLAHVNAALAGKEGA